MEKKERKYYNRAAVTGANIQEKKGYKLLNLRFSAWDSEAKEQVNKYFTMFLSEDNNERNQEHIRLLTGQEPPKFVTAEAVEKLSGLGLRTVDLVEETNDAGYANIKYINEPKFGVKVFTD